MSIPGAASPLFLSTAAGGAAAGYAINRSLRFDSSASSYLNRTPSSAGNRKTWTWAGWVKLAKISTDDLMIFSCRVTGYGQLQIGASGEAYIQLATRTYA